MKWFGYDPLRRYGHSKYSKLDVGRSVGPHIIYINVIYVGLFLFVLRYECIARWEWKSRTVLRFILLQAKM